VTETSDFYTKVTQPVANLTFAFLSVASRQLVFGLLFVFRFLCLGKCGRFNEPEHKKRVSSDTSGSAAQRRSSKIRSSERHTTVLITQATKLISLYTVYNSHCMYEEHKQSGRIGRSDTPRRSIKPILATLAVSAIVAVRTSVWTHICLLHTATNPALTSTILSVADLFGTYDRT
jgi:hypothetical protein